MSTKATGNKITARERARAARLRIDAEREARDRQLEKEAAGFFDLADRREALTLELAHLEASMGERLNAISDLGETTKRIGALLDVEPSEQRRLRALTNPVSASTNE